MNLVTVPLPVVFAWPVFSSKMVVALVNFFIRSCLMRILVMRYKTLLAAGIVRDIEFRSSEIFDLYLDALDHKNVVYKVLDTYVRPDGSMIVRILQQHNNSDLIQLY